MTRTTRKSTSRALRRCVALLAALIVLATWSVAWAFPVGMCDEHAQSAYAPFPLLPSHNGEASQAWGCDAEGRYELSRAPSPDRQRSSFAPPNIERLPPLAPFAMPRCRGQLLFPAETEGLAPRPGFQSDVFRPPRG